MKSPALLVFHLCALAIAAMAFAAETPKTIPAGSSGVSPSGKPEPAVKVRVLEGHSGSVLAVAFSPDGKMLLTGSRDRTIKLWDPRSGELKRTLTEHTADVYGLAFSPDGELLASASGDRTIRLWDARTFTTKNVLEGHTGIVRAVAFSPDGRKLVSVSVDLTVRLWDVASGRLEKSLTGHTARVKSASWSPDGKTIATASSDQTIRLWDALTGEPKAVLEGHTGDIEEVTYSPDGKTLASSSNDTTIRLWDAATGKVTRTLEGHTAEVDSVAFSPNGKMIISGSKDMLVKLWDAQTANLSRTLTGHTGRIESLTFSPDGGTLATGGGGGDTTVRLWAIASFVPSTGKPDVLAAIADQPGLPRVLLIGDSISIGYTLPVRALLKAKANIHRIPTNGGPTKTGAANIEEWLGSGKWDVIHFNFGIHDRATPLADYEQRLETLITRMKATGARLIWATTTPVPTETGYGPAATQAIIERNEAAARLMTKHGIAVDDLFTFITPHVAKAQLPKDVHFNGVGYGLLGGKVAECIEATLKPR